MKKTLLAVTCALIVSTTQMANADEGMWVPQQLPEISASLKKAGLKLKPAQLSNLTGDPLGAVVSLGGCTASFVSPEGLVVTNHHCAYGAIQLNSTPEKNLMKDGFYAAGKQQEITAGPNSRIYVLDSIMDVTDQAKAAIAGAKDDPSRAKALDELEKRLIANCETGGGYRCRFYSFMGGNQYRLFKNIEIKDVRLVYAPPGSVGVFGGDIDNWMWPRHTGDFAFYRAYVGPDGKPAPYSPGNVPFKPKQWLKFADKALGAGDFVMVAGYPGRTSRYALAKEFEETATWQYPLVTATYKQLIALVNQEGAKNPDIEVKYASTVRSWENVEKNYDGQLDGFKRINASAKKQQEEQAVLAWLKQKGAEGDAALKAYEEISKQNSEISKTRDSDFIFGGFNRTGVVGTAITLYRLSIEKEKRDTEREAGYQDRDLPAIEGSLKEMERRYVPEMDSKLQEFWLNKYIALPDGQHIAAFDEWLGKTNERSVRRAVDQLKKTRVGHVDERMKWFKASRQEFEKSKDPAIQYAVEIMPTLLEKEQKSKAQIGSMLVNRPVYLQAVADYKKSKGQNVYPDANSSLRITFGNVMPYTKLDGSKQQPFTTLEQIVAKNTGKEPFDAPQVLVDAVDAKRYAGLEDKRIGSVPVNFLSNLDITGGNSGSPVMDGQGKLVGLAFDMNWEAVVSNWLFDPEMTRMISVDQRYMQWIMQEVYPAPELLKELNLDKKQSGKKKRK